MLHLKKHSILYILILTFCFQTCDEIILLPTKGDILGKVLTINELPIRDAQVTAFYFEANENGSQENESTITVTSNDEGFYYLSDVFNEVRIEVSAEGFESKTLFVEIEKQGEELELDILLSPFNVSGKINGIVLDNNGNKVATGMINGKFIDPLTNSLTNNNVPISSEGTYSINNGFDVVLLEANVPGLQMAPVEVFIDEPGISIQQDLNLEGSPTIRSVNSNGNIISIVNQDSVELLIQVEDTYNQNTDVNNYEVSLLFYNSNNELVRIDTKNTGNIILDNYSQEQFLFKAFITAVNLNPEEHNLTIETLDPDGHQHLLTDVFTLEVIN